MRYIKKLVAVLLTLCLCLGLLPFAASASFPDISDAATARNAEVLRLMGVMEGNELGQFMPGNSLTRAEFTKMCVVLTGRREEAARYASRTIFPDVRASHWAAPYVNLAAAGELRFIHGLPDGSFGAEKVITYGESATILMRLLGYEDADAGGIWPDGYLALADAAGVSEGLSLGGASAVTRSQAARLFVNVLTAQGKDGSPFWERLGTLGERTTLRAVENGRLITEAEEKGVPMEHPVESSILAGSPGRVLSNAAGKALTFLPEENSSVVSVPNAALILRSDGGREPLDALTGGRTDFQVYRNGQPSSLSALKQYDVVTYSAGDNSLRACDVRVSVYYEDCEPSQTAPTAIRVLGGTRLEVMPTAQAGLAAFKPGDRMLLQLTADGRVAGAVKQSSQLRSNAVAVVDAAGAAKLFCCGQLLPLALTPPQDAAGKAISFEQTGETRFRFEVLQGGTVGELDVRARTLGAATLTPNCLIFAGGEPVALSALTRTYRSDEVYYSHSAGGRLVDLVVLARDGRSGVYYGRAIVTHETAYDPDFGEQEYDTLQLDYGGEALLTPGEDGLPRLQTPVRNGEFVRAELTNGRVVRVESMSYVTVPDSAWIGDDVVLVDGAGYRVAKEMPCYNLNSGKWFNSVKAARSYTGSVNVYIADGEVRLITAGA